MKIFFCQGHQDHSKSGQTGIVILDSGKYSYIKYIIKYSSYWKFSIANKGISETNQLKIQCGFITSSVTKSWQ
jgi:hypothetical protein